MQKLDVHSCWPSLVVKNFAQTLEGNGDCSRVGGGTRAFHLGVGVESQSSSNVLAGILR